MAGSSDYDVEAILRDGQKLREFVSAAFEAVDSDRSGFIEEEELNTLMQSVASDVGMEPPSESDVKEVLRDLDA